MAAILLDSCVWGGALPVLNDLGHDAVWSGAWPLDPGDSAILAAAHSERRILITLDKDFGELAIVKGLPHSGIVRLTGFRAAQMAMVIDHIVTNLPAGTPFRRDHHRGPRADSYSSLVTFSATNPLGVVASAGRYPSKRMAKGQRAATVPFSLTETQKHRFHRSTSLQSLVAA